MFKILKKIKAIYLQEDDDVVLFDMRRDNMTALDVAKYVISKCTIDGKPVSNLKLQKILYFIYGRYYAKYKEFLFKDNFVAWKLGPVVSNVYFDYNRYIAEPIQIDYKVDLGLVDERVNFIDRVVKELRDKTTWELVEESHKTMPWIKTFDNGKGKGNVIDRNDIADYFEEKYNGK